MQRTPPSSLLPLLSSLPRGLTLQLPLPFAILAVDCGPTPSTVTIRVTVLGRLIMALAPGPVTRQVTSASPTPIWRCPPGAACRSLSARPLARPALTAARPAAQSESP
eukprot:765504-Hanusia_phi.AAC.6